MITHTHDDLGWIITVDEYYSRLKPKMLPVGVESIYNTVLIELERDPSKRFSFAETGFLTRWVESHDEYDNARLKKLIENGQIELIGGGWVQPDEAASHYVELIDQYTLGLRILNESYGECGRPKVAWQIDPFGHSREHANIAVGIGYEALFFARLHYLEHDKRVQNRTLEFVWDTSDDFKKNQILTGQFYQGNYAPPPGYCFDALCADDPIVTSPKLQGFNIDSKVDGLIDFVKAQVKAQRHRNVMLLMGGDFQYSNANQVFINMDKLITVANARSNETKIVFKYSTPSCYVKSLSDAGPRLLQRTGDTFPHATANHSYWTGYFTSKPVMKGLVRSSSNFLQLVRSLDALVLFQNNENSANIEKLERAVALTQHHDAVTGTSKENVTRDYERRLLDGWSSNQVVLQRTLQRLSNVPANVTFPKQFICLLSNESICPLTKIVKKVALTVYNGHSHTVKTVLRIPYYYDIVNVKGPKGENIEFELKKSFIPKDQLTSNDSAPYELQFPVEIPALGFKTFFVSREKKNTDRTTTSFERVRDDLRIFQRKRVTNNRREIPSPVFGNSSETKITNNIIELTFDAFGRLRKFTNLKENYTHELTQEFLYYESMNKSFFLDQASGAYIFRPKGEAKRLEANISIEVSSGKFIQEVRQIVNPWISQVIRLFADKDFVEFDWIVGPILKEEQNPIGKEVISRYAVKSIKNAGYFYTDSNGRQMIERIRNQAPYYEFEKTEPISGNYYPIPTRIQISDDSTQLTVLTDRSQGGTSLVDGQVELMLHRRMYQDDNFGVEESLDEPGVDGRGLVARGKHWLILEAKKDQKKHRQLALELFHQPVVTFSPIKSTSNFRSSVITEFTGIQKSLPENIHLLTLKQISKNSVLLRLEHFLQNGEDLSLAQPVVVDLDQIFSTLDVIAVEELLLAGNIRTGERKDLPRSWNRSIRILDVSGRERFSIQLKPMEIKTLMLEVKFRKGYVGK
ncbi:hypothetical protein FO519_007149 [Halicephalobus sp. NKZ332]|nr:hypothetical protein FO519_007149 [Halicephalobus sp. NKZ332]